MFGTKAWILLLGGFLSLGRWDDQSWKQNRRWAGSAPFSFVANRVHSGGNAFHCYLSALPGVFQARKQQVSCAPPFTCWNALKIVLIQHPFCNRKYCRCRCLATSCQGKLSISKHAFSWTPNKPSKIMQVERIVCLTVQKLWLTHGFYMQRCNCVCMWMPFLFSMHSFESFQQQSPTP